MGSHYSTSAKGLILSGKSLKDLEDVKGVSAAAFSSLPGPLERIDLSKNKLSELNAKTVSALLTSSILLENITVLCFKKNRLAEFPQAILHLRPSLLLSSRRRAHLLHSPSQKPGPRFQRANCNS